MSRLSCVLAVALATLMLAVPLARAAPSAPVEGALSIGGDIVLEGAVAMRAAQGILDLAPERSAAPAATLSWSSASGIAYHARWAYVGSPATDLSVGYFLGSSAERFSLDAGTLDSLECLEHRCRMFVYVAEGDKGTIGLEGDAAERLRWTTTSWTYVGGSDREGRGWRYVVPEHWLRASTAGTAELVFPGGRTVHDDPVLETPDTLPIVDATPVAEGTLTLVLYNMTGRLTTSEGSSQLTAAKSHKQVAGDGFAASVSEEDSVHYVITLRDARLTAVPGTHAILAAPEATFDVDGAWRAADATGTLRSGDRTYRLLGEPLRIAGATQLGVVANPVPEGALGGTRLETRAQVSGAMAQLDVAGARLDIALASNAAATLGLLALALLAASRLLQLGIAGYSRIRPSDLLSNENRRRLYEAVRGAPGRTLTDHARALSTPRVVVEHHARLLQAHRLIVTRAVGWRRLYYLPEDPTLVTAEADQVLADGTRRRIADAIQEGHATQTALVERTGVPQRLVSYHLKKLVDAGLVRVEDSFPKRYRFEPVSGQRPPGAA